MGIDLHYYGGQKVPWSAICKLENRKARSMILSKSQGLRTRSTDIWEQEKMDVPAQAKRANSPFLHLFLLLRPSTDCMMPPTLARTVFFTQSSNSNVNVFQKHSQKYPEIMFYQLFRHPLAQSSWHIKLIISRTKIFLPGARSSDGRQLSAISPIQEMSQLKKPPKPWPHGKGNYIQWLTNMRVWRSSRPHTHAGNLEGSSQFQNSHRVSWGLHWECIIAQILFVQCCFFLFTSISVDPKGILS